MIQSLPYPSGAGFALHRTGRVKFHGASPFIKIKPIQLRTNKI